MEWLLPSVAARLDLSQILQLPTADTTTESNADNKFGYGNPVWRNDVMWKRYSSPKKTAAAKKAPQVARTIPSAGTRRNPVSGAGEKSTFAEGSRYAPRVRLPKMSPVLEEPEEHVGTYRDGSATALAYLNRGCREMRQVYGEKPCPVPLREFKKKPAPTSVYRGRTNDAKAVMARKAMPPSNARGGPTNVLPVSTDVKTRLKSAYAVMKTPGAPTVAFLSTYGERQRLRWKELALENSILRKRILNAKSTLPAYR